MDQEEEKGKTSKLLLSVGTLFIAWNAVTMVDTMNSVEILNSKNEFRMALPIRLADEFKKNTDLGREMSSSARGEMYIDVVEGTATVLGGLGVMLGHNAGVLIYE